MTSLVLISVIVFVVAFCLGSIPWGVIISMKFFKQDVRDFGSHNIGTTNMLRQFGKKAGISVFVLDSLKGALAGIIALQACKLVPDSSAMAADYLNHLMTTIAFLGCVWGHVFSPWLGFKGGKGVAVSIGCLFVTFGYVGALIELAIFLLLAITTRIVSVGSLCAAVACPCLAAYYYLYLPATGPEVFPFVLCLLAGLTVIWAHRSNISRLLKGEEKRIGQKKSDDGRKPDQSGQEQPSQSQPGQDQS